MGGQEPERSGVSAWNVIGVQWNELVGDGYKVIRQFIGQVLVAQMGPYGVDGPCPGSIRDRDVFEDFVWDRSPTLLLQSFNGFLVIFTLGFFY